MLKIREVTIRNFRSIVDQTIETNDMNVFVGLNDVGKSNVLKALNLFFNGETDIKRAFDFETDLSKTASYREKRAKEITVSLKIDIPPTYVNSGFVIWKKVWRSGSSGITPFLDEQMILDRSSGSKTPFSARSKTPIALRRMKYHYIPAVKSDTFFRHLLGDLYTNTSKQVDSLLESKAKDYSVALQIFAQRISDIVKEKIGIESALAMPENQMDIFKQLAFGTKDGQQNDILLDYRGDGVKARHIPAILKFMQEQDIAATTNAVPYSIIWGYEEPENGLEMLKCFDLANQFCAYSNEIQMFITTHSPAFYSQSDSPNVNVHSVSQDQKSCTQIEHEVKISSIDETIGLLPIISPYINEQVQKIKEYEGILKSNFLTNIDTIIVEGKTDKYYLTCAIKALCSRLASKLQNRTLRILTKDSCGVKQLHDWILSWCLAGFDKKLIALFDSDEAGDKWIAKVRENSIFNNYTKNQPLLLKYQPSDTIIELFRKDVLFPFSVEHLFPLELWSLPQVRDLLIQRNTDSCQYMLQKLQRLDNTLSSIIDDLSVTDDVKELWIRNILPNESGVKNTFSAIVNQSPVTQRELFSGFARTIDALEKKM